MSLKKQISILAIETSADETSAAVLVGEPKKPGRFKLRSNLIYSQIAIHRKTHGIVPEVAARAHIPKILPVIKLALAKAKIKLKNLDSLAVTAGPGLVTSLRIGVDTAKALAFALQKPIIPVNHMEGHLLSALATTYKLQPTSLFPAVGLTVSGGHTMLVLVKDFGKYKILGQTLDDAAGECFDKVAKLLGLPYPGGPSVALRATKFKMQNAKLKIELPRPMINTSNYNFSFAGLKTAVLYKVKELQKNKIKITNPIINQIAHETQKAIVEVLVAKTLRAAKAYKVKTILLGGGVSANRKLRQTLAKEIKNQIPNSIFYIPDSSLTTDNAGMIAVAAFYHYISDDITSYHKVKADPNWDLKTWR